MEKCLDQHEKFSPHLIVVIVHHHLGWSYSRGEAARVQSKTPRAAREEEGGS